MREIYILGLLASLLVGQAATTSDFSKTCDEIKVGDEGSSVQAKCTTKTPMGPPWVCTKLDLNKCLGSESGGLVAKDGGDFTKMCDTCGESESLVLGCQCWTGAYFPDGSLIYDYTEFKLDDVVGNEDGYLKCFDNVAPKATGCD